MKKFQHIGWPVELGGQFRLVPFQRLCAHPWVLYVYMDQMLDQPNSKRVFMHPGSLRIHPTINQQLQCKFWVRKCCQPLSYIKQLNEAPFLIQLKWEFHAFLSPPFASDFKIPNKDSAFYFSVSIFLRGICSSALCLPSLCYHLPSWDFMDFLEVNLNR